MTKFLHGFVKVTGFIVYALVFRTKIHFQNKKEQGRKIDGAAIIISNHTSVFDYAQMLYLFPFRVLRYVVAELLMNRRFLGTFLKLMGAIKVDRNSFDFAFIGKCEEILEKGGVVGIFPESRLPRQGEERPLDFKPSAAYIALRSGAPIIPVYTDGKYFCAERANIIIGEKIYVSDLVDESLPEKEQVAQISVLLREKILELRDELQRQTGKTEKEQKEETPV